jgi:phosphatidylglycerophosphate synthase
VASGIPTTTVVRRRTNEQLAAALGGQSVLLATVSAVAHLGLVGWLAGIAYACGLCGVLGGAARRAGLRTLGPAGLVTLGRAVLVGGVTALVADGLWNGDTSVAILVVIAAVALLLDAVDGRVARRSGTASAFGARFDMEVDAFLLLVLSAYVAVLVGPWVLAIGAMRYAFVVASYAIPWMRSTVPARYSAKAVAAAQGIVLTLATSDVLPRPLAVALIWTALVALVWSFGGDVAWLWSRNSGRKAQREIAAAA